MTADYADRRARCGVPADLAFQTRTALAWAMIAGLHARGALPFRWVTGDEHFGNTPVLLDRIAAVGLAYFMEVPHNVRVWPDRPPTAVPAATGRKGHPHTRVRLAPGAPAARRVDALAAQLPAARLAGGADPGRQQGAAGGGGRVRTRRRRARRPARPGRLGRLPARAGRDA